MSPFANSAMSPPKRSSKHSSNTNRHRSNGRKINPNRSRGPLLTTSRPRLSRPIAMPVIPVRFTAYRLARTRHRRRRRPGGITRGARCSDSFGRRRPVAVPVVAVGLATGRLARAWYGGSDIAAFFFRGRGGSFCWAVAVPVWVSLIARYS